MVEALLVALVLAESLLPAAPAPPPPPAAPSAEEGDAPEPGDRVSLLEYQVAQVSRTDVASGRTQVAIETGAPSPRAGSFPMRFFIDNTSGPTQAVTVSLRGSVGGANHVARRTVEVKAGERRTVSLPVLSELHYGIARAEGPGIQEHTGNSTYTQAISPPARLVLTLSPPEAFEQYVGRPPRYSGANVQVHAITPDEAPVELAAYTGYDLVVVPTGTQLEALDEAQRGALEAFVATGGHLLLGDPVRSGGLFPLAARLAPGANAYGFGKVFLAASAEADQLGVLRNGFPVLPEGPVPEHRRRWDSAPPAGLLLPQATAPLGRFLLIIGLFTLAIGPGSVWVSRRRGPAALLFTIPGTAFVTCALIVGYSLMADGFTVHSASYGYSLLDGRGHRLVTAGVTAYYANLAPSRARFGSSTALVGPTGDFAERAVADQSWTEGLTLGGDFVPSRTYREWGFLTVEPSRARLLARPKGQGWVVQNALGVAVDRVTVNVGGRFFTGGPVADGAEAPLEAGEPLAFSGSAGAARFSGPVADAVARRPLEDGEFLARLDGASLVPTGGVRTSVHAAVHWVRGEVER